MWDGVFAPTVKKSIADHFDIVNIKKDEVVGIVTVTVEFHKSPGKMYDFVIAEEDFDADKAKIGSEIARQLSE